MEENKFEKQVQRQMGDFKIPPSDAVWGKIESRIQKKKRYRWLLFLLFFLLIGAAAVFMKNGVSTDNQKSITAKNISKDTIATSKILVAKTLPILPQNKDSIHSTIGLANHHQLPVSAKSPVVLIEKKDSIYSTMGLANDHQHRVSSKAHITAISGRIGHPTNAEAQSIEQKRSLSTKGKMKVDSKHEEEVLIHEADQEIAITTPTPKQEKEGNNKNDKTKEVPSIVEIKDTAAIVKKVQPVIVPDTTVHVIAKSKTIINAGKKWVTGLLFNVGISGIGNGFLGLMTSSVSANYSLTGVVPPTALPKLKAGPGFTIGITEEKSVFKKLSLVAGIAFSSLTTRIKVGADTSTFVVRDTLQALANHYNFLELPLSLKLQIGKGSWFWQGGMVISQLISSNALQLNSNTGSYSTNNSLLHKTQLGLNTSLSFAFLSGKNTFLIGPYFYYDVSKIADQGLYLGKHFVFAGLHTQVLFKGKKK